MNKDDKRIMTGIASLDNVFGGFRPGTLNAIAGGASSGKSAFAVQTAVNAASEGKAVLFFTLEMSKEEVAGRIDRVNKNPDKDRIATRIIIDDCTVVNPEYISDKIDESSKSMAVDLVVIDYFALLTAPGNANNTDISWREASMLCCRELNRIARVYNLPIILITSFSRGATYEDALYRRLHVLFRSQPWVEQDAKSIIVLPYYGYHRYDMFDEWHGHPLMNRSQMIIEKNGFGDIGIIDVKWDRENLRFLGFERQCAHGFQTFELLSEEIRKDLMEGAFKAIDGCYSFESAVNCINPDYRWFVTCDSDNDLFDRKKVLAISVFEKDHGWKLIGMYKRVIGKDERNREENNETRRKVREALKEHIRYLMDVRSGWAELVWGSKLEKLFAKACTAHEIIDPYEIKDNKLYPQVDVNPYSELHYACPYNPNGDNTWRIAYGSIKWN